MSRVEVLNSRRSKVQKPSRQKLAIQWAGLFLGPILAVLCLQYLPSEYVSGQAVQGDETVSMARSDSASSETNTPSNAPADSASVEGQADDVNVDASMDGAAKSAVAEFSWAGRATLAVMVWMGIWWLTEAIEISATALLPLVLFPILGAADIKAAAFPYASHLIFLYFGGFVIALSMERWGLGKRIALLTLRIIGTSAPRMIAGFMVVTAVLSAFVSNTATTAMMLPIAISTIALLRSQIGGADGAMDPASEGKVMRFGTCLLLAIAYSASVGGIMTIIGTPTNAFLVGFLRDTIADEYRLDFSFAGWLPIGASLVVVFLPIMYLMLTRFLFPIREIELSGGEKMIQSEIDKLGRVQIGEWNTLLIFLAAIVLWLTRPLIAGLEVTWNGSVYQPLSGLTDTGVAMIAALLLFLLPVSIPRREFTMDWETVNKMPWGILILFGGGLSLAQAVRANGVAEFIGSYAGRFGDVPVFVTVLVVTAAIVFLTELTSNVATTTSLVPVLAAIAPGVGIHPYLLIIPATVAASCAFMLPVATPPNAIVFGSGEITLPQMVRAGFLLNIISMLIVTILAFVVVRPWLGF